MAKAASSAVVSPCLGLVFNKTLIDIPPSALQDGNNFRIKNGKLNNYNLGWRKFTTNWVLNGPVVLIDNFFPRNVNEQLIFASPTDLYLYGAVTDTVRYLTPQYNTGTAAASGTAVTGTGTAWNGLIKAGDFIAFGNANEVATSASWFEVASVSSDTSLTLSTDAGTVVDGPYTIRRTFTGGLHNPWDSDTFVNDGASGDDLWFATNGVDSVVTWNGTDNVATLHDELGFKCQTLAAYKNMMIYGNLTEGGDNRFSSIINSDVGYPLQAGSAASGTGLAGEYKVHGGTDDILNLIPLGESLMIYAETHIIVAQFTGDVTVFLFRQGVEGVGPISGNAIADFGSYHEFLGSDAQYAWDGVSVNEIDSQVFRNILRTMDPLRRRNTYAHYDEEDGDLIWVTPLATDAGAGDQDSPPESAVVEHYLEDVKPQEDTPFSRRDFPFTITGFYERDTGITWNSIAAAWTEYNFAWDDQFFALAFPQNLAGDNNGQVWIFNEDQKRDGADYISFVKFGRRALGDGKQRNLLTRVYPFAEVSPGGTLTVNTYMADFAAGPSALKDSSAFSLDLNEGAFFVSPFNAGRYCEIEFKSTGSAWQLDGYDIDVRPGGRR